jgi:hypothetical protein
MAFERSAVQRAGRHFYPGIYGIQIVRLYGLRGSAHAKVFEVDLPAVWAQKKHRRQKHPGRLPAHVTLLPIDFATQDLGAVFTGTVFDPASPAVSVRGSVRPYHSQAVGQDWHSGPCVHLCLAGAHTMLDRMAKQGTPWLCGLQADVGSAEHQASYLTPLGRTQVVPAIERSAVARLRGKERVTHGTHRQ